MTHNSYLYSIDAYVRPVGKSAAPRKSTVSFIRQFARANVALEGAVAGDICIN